MTTPQRSSQETERRHLLAPSTTPSARTSTIDLTAASGQTTPRAARGQSPARSQTQTERQEQSQPQPYRGFPSEEAYLAALQEWADSKKYLEPGTGLFGFYGNVTSEEYARRPRVELGLRRKVKGWRAKRRGVGGGDGGGEVVAG